KSFKFPLPLTSTFACRDSEAFKCVLLVVTEKSNFPTAPVKLAGFPWVGNGFTFKVLFPADTVLLVWFIIRPPKKSLLFVGTSTVTSKERGSISSFPVFWGYSTTLFKTTERYGCPLYVLLFCTSYLVTGISWLQKLLYLGLSKALKLDKLILFEKYNLYTTLTASLRYGLALETSATKCKLSSATSSAVIWSLGLSTAAVTSTSLGIDL